MAGCLSTGDGTSQQAAARLHCKLYSRIRGEVFTRRVQVQLEAALNKVPSQLDSERPRNYLPKMPCATPSYYPQTPPQSADSLDYYLRLSPETLFFVFYYMEVGRVCHFITTSCSTEESCSGLEGSTAGSESPEEAVVEVPHQVISLSRQLPTINDAEFQVRHVVPEARGAEGDH